MPNYEGITPNPGIRSTEIPELTLTELEAYVDEIKEILPPDYEKSIREIYPDIDHGDIFQTAIAHLPASSVEEALIKDRAWRLFALAFPENRELQQREPSPEIITEVGALVEKYDESFIERVMSITEPEVALHDPERLQLRDDIAKVYRKLRDTKFKTRIAYDINKTAYPEFWTIHDKFLRMHQAVGLINRITNSVRHNLSISPR